MTSVAKSTTFDASRMAFFNFAGVTVMMPYCALSLRSMRRLNDCAAFVPPGVICFNSAWLLLSLPTRSCLHVVASCRAPGDEQVSDRRACQVDGVVAQRLHNSFTPTHHGLDL